MTTAEERYIKIKEFIAFLYGPVGRQQYDANPTMLEKAKEAGKMLKKIVLEEKSQPGSQLYKVTSEIQQYLDFRQDVPSTSQDTLQVINNTITELSKELETLLNYYPEMYYNIYFFMNGLTQDMARVLPHTQSGGNFNDWFYGSKVVDSEGNPLIVYHGTGSTEFTKWSFNLFPGAYFGENKSYSEWFRQRKAGDDGKMYECYLRVLNPMDLRFFGTDLVKYEYLVDYLELQYGYTMPENKMLKIASDQKGGLWLWVYLRSSPEWLLKIKNDKMFDGIMFYENNPEEIIDGKENVTPAWLVFNSNQIKYAKGNLTYSLSSDDFRFKKGGEI